MAGPLKSVPQATQTATIKAVMARQGWSHSGTYRLLQRGDIKAVKNGRRTLIILASVDAYVASLPQATFRSAGSGGAEAARAA